MKTNRTSVKGIAKGAAKQVSTQPKVSRSPDLIPKSLTLALIDETGKQVASYEMPSGQSAALIAATSGDWREGITCTIEDAFIGYRDEIFGRFEPSRIDDSLPHEVHEAKKRMTEFERQAMQCVGSKYGRMWPDELWAKAINMQREAASLLAALRVLERDAEAWQCIVPLKAA